MDTELEEMKDILKKYGQEHLLNHYNELDEKKKEILLNQIRNIDFELVNKLYDSTKEQKVNTNDKILTLSTCKDNFGNRVVMHAKLIKRELR